MKSWKYILPIVLTLSIAHIAVADEGSGYQRIIGLGCHAYDGECYVTLEGPAYGPKKCSATQARWNIHDTLNGRAILALLTSAKMSGEWVYIHSFDCFSDIYPGRPKVPRVGFINIKNPEDVP
jgi:hypothetical protein